MSPTEAAARVAAAHGRGGAEEWMRTCDVRLRREITHRRLAISLARRSLRVLTLHVLDGALLAATASLLAEATGRAAEVRPLIPAVVLVFLLSLNALASYAAGEARRDRRRLALGVLLGTLILAGLSVLPPHLPFPHLFLAQLAASAFLALAVGRKLADLAVRQAYVRGIGLRRAVIVGGLDEAGTVIRDLRTAQQIDQYIVGHVTPDDRPDPAALGRLEDLPRVLDTMEVQEVLVASSLPPEMMRMVTSCCFERGNDLFVVPGVARGLDCWSEPLRVGECPLLRLHPARLEFPSLLMKRGVDLVLATLALVALSPVIAVVAVGIKLDSPGSVFFRQERVGLGGRRFRMWKFRSMVVGAEAREMELAHLSIYGGNGTFKVRDDPRITRMGRILRRTSLDELPQLLNVLSGEMSLVGPRPALVNDISRYQPHHFERLSVVPGITGPWQVGGRNLITDFETIVRMEREYISHWSLLLDLKIMLRTVGVVVRGEGAY